MVISREPHTLDLHHFRSSEIIGVDGDQGGGKTTLASELRACLGGEVISLDDFLLGNGAAYLAQVDQQSLRARVNSASQRPLIFEGVLLLQVLDMISIRPDCLVFTKAVFEGTWQYEQYLRPGKPLPKSKLTREIAEYYRTWRPFDKAAVKTVLYVSARP